MGEEPEQEILIVTGMSGAGRSTVGNALEDLGWYVVDNLPPQMLMPLVELVTRAGTSIPKIAAVVDIRGGSLFSELEQLMAGLRDQANVRLMFLDASDDALVRRFESVRRPHPLQGTGTLLDGLRAERERLAALRSSSDILIDTSELNIHQLANRIAAGFAEDDGVGVKVTLLSFGFKYGLPTDADLVADARFLPNPFWVPDLRALNGEDAEVADFVLGQEGASEFLDAYTAALRPVLAGYQRENKRHATIAVGCTGGKHRSVAIVRELSRRIGVIPGVAVSVRHRDLGRE
ncbi:RNase adapter RapZ [Agromyces archimandritae]|uniref:RNase adapter RapZ n=2 Tax=Agromyces archimandritae TaxID=2781962 RepID=A0A975FPS3_9MICO|nr:RNase adapter RapZ [Agromyces archimandritae]